MTTTHTERQPLPSFINMRALRRKLGDAAPSTIRAMVADGLLPAPVKPRHNLCLFDEAAVHAAISRWPRAAA